MSATGWIVIVWNGSEWFAGPVVYETQEHALDAATRVTLAPIRVIPVGEMFPAVAPSISEYRRLRVMNALSHRPR